MAQFERGANTIQCPWGKDFPKIMCQTTRQAIMTKFADLFNRAKAGEGDASLKLVARIVKEDKVRALAMRHPKAFLVPVYAIERTGWNKLTLAYAMRIADLTGLKIEDQIVQTVRAFHTGANYAERLQRPALFDGPVFEGQEYILVDDHSTLGDTLNALRNYIENKGGKVVEVTTLTISRFSSQIAITPQTLEILRAKSHGTINTFLQEHGIARNAESITEKTARYILTNFK